MKVVYSEETSYSEWNSHLGRYDDVPYMGEVSWTVGEIFKNGFIRGVVSEIRFDEDNGVSVWVFGEKENNQVVALWIAPHAVQRLYYGE